ncbi:MAG: acetyl-CoA carboxylase carboxyltransferase subunit alpha [Anaerocolumna sp.]
MDNKLSAWERMDLIRSQERPRASDYIEKIFENFIECHGDRCFGDDGAIIGGIALFENRPVTVIANAKGKGLANNKKSNFGMAHPEGYRKALRLMKQAEKFHRPIICLIDTPGAYCGKEAEERGQHEAIARNIAEMMQLKTLIISIIIGEGGSGGAMAMAVCDQLGMMQNAIYSVISPRGFASILWKDSSREREAANLIKITAEDMLNFGVCDAIIPEPEGGCQKNFTDTIGKISVFIRNILIQLDTMDINQIINNRYNKYRKIEFFYEG